MDYDLLVRNGRVVDGSGLASYRADVGVTSVITGNCGLTLAPVKKGGEDALVKSFVRVEAIPRYALEQGVRWGWHTFVGTARQQVNLTKAEQDSEIGGSLGYLWPLLTS